MLQEPPKQEAPKVSEGPNFPRSYEITREGPSLFIVNESGDGMTFADGRTKLGQQHLVTVEVVEHDGKRGISRSSTSPLDINNGLGGAPVPPELRQELESFALEDVGEPNPLRPSRRKVVLPMTRGEVTIRFVGFDERTGYAKFLIEFNGAPDPHQQNMAFVATHVGDFGRDFEPEEQWIVPSSVLEKLTEEDHVALYTALRGLTLQAIAIGSPEPWVVTVGDPQT